MKLSIPFRILFAGFLILTVLCGDAVAQRQQSTTPDSLAALRKSKSIASKSMDQKTYATKEPMAYSQLRYSRSFATVEQCKYETSKGLRCKRNAEAGSLYCKLHEKAGAKLKSETAKQK